jgi:hypothetical protein
MINKVNVLKTGDSINLGDGELAMILNIKTKDELGFQISDVYFYVAASVGSHWISAEVVYRYNQDLIRDRKIEEVIGD